MNFEKFHPKSKVWAYTSSKEFNRTEIVALNKHIEEFCRQWTAHDVRLKAAGHITFNRILVLMVDETETSASGCSIDKSIKFIQALGRQMECDFLVRNLVAVQQNNSWVWVDFKSIPDMLDSQEVNPNTLIIDHLINDYHAFSSWVKPLSESWLSRYLKEPAQ